MSALCVNNYGLVVVVLVYNVTRDWVRTYVRNREAEQSDGCHALIFVRQRITNCLFVLSI